MVSLAALWLAIVVAAVLVFFASYAVHTLLGYHGTDFRKVPDEDGGMDAIRGLNLPAGDYHMPRPPSAAAMRDPDFLAIHEFGNHPSLAIKAAAQVGFPATKMYSFVWGIGEIDIELAGAQVPSAHRAGQHEVQQDQGDPVRIHLQMSPGLFGVGGVEYQEAVEFQQLLQPSADIVAVFDDEDGTAAYGESRTERLSWIRDRRAHVAHLGHSHWTGTETCVP